MFLMTTSLSSRSSKSVILFMYPPPLIFSPRNIIREGGSAGNDPYIKRTRISQFQ